MPPLDIFADTGDRPFLERAGENSVLLDNPRSHEIYVAAANERAIRGRLIFVPTVPLGTRVTLAPWQTGFRDQAGRGSCYAFAAIAALEAAYRRRFGVVLDLSEQYAFHINKASELFSDYMTTSATIENNSSIWGFQGSSDIIDKMARFAVPEESACPYLADTQMQALLAATPAAGSLSNQEELDAFEFAEGHIPTAARHACRYRVKDFRALPPNPSVDDVQSVIAAGFEVVADIPNHCFLIVGYDLGSRNFIVKNSWGENRFITYGFDQPILGGRYITDVHPPTAPAQKEAWWMGRWNMDIDGWRGSLVIRRWTDYRHGDSEPTKLGSYYSDGKRFDVNGLRLDEGQRLLFWIAGTTDKVQPGSPSGQVFQSCVFSFDPVNAAGVTHWRGIEFGVTMRRMPLPSRPPMSPFDENEWIGHWDMNHDGWRGRLDIWSVRPLRGLYRDASGIGRSISGSLRAGQPHILEVSIEFSPGFHQPFELCHSTWEKRVFAGFTTWNNRMFGVQGERQDLFQVYGAIRAKWIELGAFQGALGKPWTDETVTADGRGRYNHFTGGSIYWTPRTGAVVVRGEIRRAWVAMGAEASRLGYPVGDEKGGDDRAGGRYSDFERGRLVLDPCGGVSDG
jgi:hypothetical protein